MKPYGVWRVWFRHELILLITSHLKFHTFIYNRDVVLLDLIEYVVGNLHNTHRLARTYTERNGRPP
jgi:hypothetical protein